MNKNGELSSFLNICAYVHSSIISTELDLAPDMPLSLNSVGRAAGGEGNGFEPRQS